MSTIRATYVQHGSSAVPNITLNASGQVIVASGIVSSGTFAAPSGSVSAPGIYFNGDPNTGIYSPGADQVAISTGGSGRLFVDASGNVEIAGTGNRIRGDFSNATHANRLSFQTSTTDGATSPFFIPNGTSTSAQAIVCNASDPTNSAFLSFGCFGGVINEARINSGKLGSGTQLPLTFHVASERLRITETGLVGIGTSSPSERLHVKDGKIAIEHTSDFASLEMGGSNGGLIDFKTPFSDDFDHRIIGNGTSFTFDNQNAGSIIFNNNGAERCRLDSSGRLLVGTSTSITTAIQPFLQVHGTGENAYMNASRWSNDANGPGILFGKSRGGSVGTRGAVANNDVLGEVSFYGDNGTSFNSAAAIYAFVDGAVSGGGANDMPGRLVFSTTADGASSPTERMRITSAGNLCINSIESDNGTGGPLCINGRASQAMSTWNIGTNGYAALYFNNASRSKVGDIIVNSGGTAYNTTSDYRLKENITAVTDGIARLQQLKPSRFNFIADPDRTVDGFLAHEVQDIVPEAITGEKDAVDKEGNPQYQGIDQSKLVPLLTAALQEAVAKIESLEARLTAAGI